MPSACTTYVVSLVDCTVNYTSPAFRACPTMTDVVDEACRFIGRHEPLHLARATAAGEDGAGDRFNAVLGVLLSVFAAVADELRPFLPDGAGRLDGLLRPVIGRTDGGSPAPAFPRLGCVAR